MQPPIVLLNGYAGSTVVPGLEALVDSMTKAEDEQTLCVILDLRTVTGIDTCVVESLKKLSLLLAPHSPARSFILVFPEYSRSTILADLDRVGIKPLRYVDDLSDLSALQSKERDLSLELTTCENPEEALMLCRSRTWHGSSTTPNTKEGQSETLQRRAQMFLSYHLRSSKAAPEHEIRERYTIRKVSSSRAIACTQYPLPPTFIVLEGKVLVQKLHIDSPEGSNRVAIRVAIVAALRNGILRLFRDRNRSEPNQASVAAQYIYPGGIFDPDLYADSCAHAVDGPCWILDFFLANEARVEP